jgi:NADH-quinone oxidoreductase subunit J
MNDGVLTLVFYALAIVAAGSALMVILVRNIFHSALFLILSFMAVSGIFVMLQADFLAAVQVLLYAGAIAILVIFAIMLTRDTTRGNPSNQETASVFIIGIVLFLLLLVVIRSTVWPVSAIPPLETTTEALANAIFYRFVLPFEAASVLLLAAMLAAIVLARDD